MVCMVEYGRMAAMVRLLKVGKIPTTAEEATHEKIAAVTLHKQFRDADEVNLLQEEDMHIFGYRPLTDPLNLVCCNACKKPVKASQYAVHAEQCRSMNSACDIGLELGSVSGNKKPPRKGKKASQTTNGKVLEEQAKSELGVHNVGHSESKLDNWSKMLATQPREVPKAQPSVGHDAAMDAPTCYQKATQVLEKGAPVPLASKVYYSQGNRRLRLHLGYLYSKSCARDLTDFPSSEAMQDNERCT